jgi:hypothetical protein
MSKAMEAWHLNLQQHQPLNEVDTSAGSYTEAPPPAGLLNTATGQSNQNQELSYSKISTDGNTFTLAGANLPLGPYTITAPGGAFKIKSNGTVWRKSG